MSVEWAQINFWAIPVAAVAAFVVGGAWYGGIFATAWLKHNNHSEEAVQEMVAKQGRNFTLFFLGDLVMAFVLALLINALALDSVGSAICLASMLWFGIAFPIGLSNHMANNKSLAAFGIDTGYELAILLVTALVLGAWR